MTYTSTIFLPGEISPVQITSDGSTNNSNKLGAVACMRFAVKETAIDDDLMITTG